MMQQTQNPEEQALNLPDFSSMAPEDEGTPLPPKPPGWRRRGAIVTIILIVLLVLASFLALFLIRGRQRQVTYVKQQVTQGNFSLTVSATGPIQSAVYNLTFSGSGTIAEVNVAVGQTVVKGQLLAKLNKTSLQDALNAAQASVLAAQTGVNNANANLSKTEAQSQASVQSAQVVLNNANASLTTTQTQSQASINSAQTALSNAQTTLSHTQAVSAANIAAAQTTLNNAQTALSNAEAALNACLASPPTTDPTCATAKAAVATAQAAFNSAQQALTTAQVQASANNANAQNGVNTAQQALSSAEAQASSNNTAAQNTVNTATAALASAQASANASITSQQGSVNSAQSQLQTAMVGLQTAQHNLANATLLAPHAGIVTTINGTVGGTPGVSSSSTSTSTGGGGGGTFITIADTSTLQVLASVNESDTANLKFGEPAQFTVSAYGNRIFTGTVSAISPLGQTVSNVVTFPVTIDVNKDDLQNANLLPGMTASTTIVVIQQPNVTLVPVNAINFARTAVATVNGIPPLITTSQAAAALAQARQMLKQILIQDPSVQQDNPIPAYIIEQPDSQASFIAVPVVLGLTDDTYYVVLQGLSPGDIIVVGAVRG
jgi:multidrug efflux pump subunit AcrA (membrane-fusion protein)